MRLDTPSPAVIPTAPASARRASGAAKPKRAVPELGAEDRKRLIALGKNPAFKLAGAKKVFRVA